MDANRKAQANALVTQAIEKAINERGEIGIQVAAYLKGEKVIDTWSGLADETTGRKVDGDTLFNVFSVTKAVAATCLHVQADRGLLDYEAPIASYWPEFAANGKEKATVRHVLTHRVGLPQMPKGVTPVLMSDWDWMCGQIAAMKPLFEPGTKSAYQSMTYGWMVGELVRRTDPKKRSLGTFLQEEICKPLGIDGLWIGLPDSAIPRVAKLTDIGPFPPIEHLPPLYMDSMPAEVALVPAVFEQPAVRRAEVAGVGGIFNARSTARLFGMLANGGEIDGVRILSEKLVKTFNIPRSNAEEVDPVMFGFPVPISIAGYWLGGNYPPVTCAKTPSAICHPGAGNSMAWADMDTGLAVSICHNRMFNPSSIEQDPMAQIADAVRQGLGLA
jgi:CubicO group peptidase (beta-lactamase class C family)